MELEERIEARLNEVLDRTLAGETCPDREPDRGLAVNLWPNPMEAMPIFVLTVADVARIAAAEARAWF